MDSESDDFLKGLQNQILDETRAAYGEVAFQRWLKPLRMGAISDPDGYGRVTGTCGDTREIFLRLEGGRVKEATFLSVDELGEYMNHAGFTDLTFNQTIFRTLARTVEDESVKPGHGEGSFVVIRGRKEQVEMTGV